MILLSALNQIRFNTHSVVSKDMIFQYFRQPCFYAENIDRWTTRWTNEDYMYLWEMRSVGDNQYYRTTPPAGIRSAVPLGGLGSGTLELRADGSFRDCNIFNNLPGCGDKIHLNDALFGVKIKTCDKTVTKILRTHPPQGFGNDQRIDAIQYSGAFPVSKLVFNDSYLPIGLSLDAFCRFAPGDADSSATPAVLFYFTLTNPTNQPVSGELLFCLPNVINGLISSTPDSLAIDAKNGGLAVVMSGAESQCMRSDDLPMMWESFVNDHVCDAGKTSRYAAATVDLQIPPGEKQYILFALAWYFPGRIAGGCKVGQFYSTLYESAIKAAYASLDMAGDTVERIASWNKKCFDCGLPDFLITGLINTPATYYKTGLRFENGAWRQFESFSCPNISPLHIDFYRSMPLATMFPSLQKSLINGYASRQDENGFIREDLGNSGTLDKNNYQSRIMGDGNTVYILCILQYYNNTNDFEFLSQLWPSVIKAVLWQTERCSPYDLPAHMLNTYDWWRFEEKDSVAYNTVLHLAAMKAAQKLARVMDDRDVEEICIDSYENVKAAYDERLWNGEYYTAYWNDGEKCSAIHADTLYGQLWAYILGLGEVLDHSKIISHLESEQRLCGSPFGLKVMRGDGRDDDHLPPFSSVRDNLVWEAGSLDWCSVGLFAGLDKQRCLEEARKILDKWNLHLADLWDIRDLSSGWDGYPWCNSHYARQLIMWAIPIALGVNIKYFACQ